MHTCAPQTLTTLWTLWCELRDPPTKRTQVYGGGGGKGHRLQWIQLNFEVLHLFFALSLLVLARGSRHMRGLPPRQCEKVLEAFEGLATPVRKIWV